MFHPLILKYFTHVPYIELVDDNHTYFSYDLNVSADGD